MKRLIFVLSLLLPVAGQVEPPALGTFVDREGQMRKLFGVSGSLIPGPPIASGVLTCGSSGERTVWKTVDRVFLSPGKEEATRSWDAPAGPARFRFAPEGLRIWFESGETGWTWRSDLDDFVPAGWLTKDDFADGEPVGEWTLFRTEQGLRVQRGDTILAVPEAAADTPKLYEIAGTGEIPISGPIVFATVGPGDSQTKRFRIRNEGVDALTINRLSVSGGGDFAITDGFTPPRIIAAGRFDDFWLRFAPQSPGARNGTLFVNTTTFEVQGSAPTWASLQATEGDGWITLSTSKVFDLGSVERGSELRRSLPVHQP